MTTNIPRSRTLGDLLDELAKIYRDNEVVIWKGSRLTYSQFKEEVDIFARSLLSLGIKRRDNVALISSNRPEWLIAMFCYCKNRRNHRCDQYFFYPARVTLGFKTQPIILCNFDFFLKKPKLH